ncbi:unnamed protein product [Boreogadus saida]
MCGRHCVARSLAERLDTDELDDQRDHRCQHVLLFCRPQDCLILGIVTLPELTVETRRDQASDRLLLAPATLLPMPEIGLDNKPCHRDPAVGPDPTGGASRHLASRCTGMSPFMSALWWATGVFHVKHALRDI